MEKKNTKLFMAALIALLTAAGGRLYASPKLFTSPQKTATATQFWSDADLFLSTTGYTAVDFEKWFGTVSFQSDIFATGQANMMQLGFAAQFSGLYAALYYGGNTLAYPDEVYREENGKRVYSALPPLFHTSGNRPYNEASVLIGVADMGFRLSYVHTYRSHKLKDFFLVNDPYTSYTDEYGSINPQIAWGMAKELIPGRGLKPHVYVDMDFFRDYQKQDKGSGEEINKSNNEFTLGFTAAAGYLSLFEQNGFDFSVDLWYTLNLKTFNNEYTPNIDPDDPSLGKAAGTIVAYKGKNVGGYYQTGYNDHSITPYLCASWSGNKLALSAELGLELGLASEKGAQFNMTGDAPVKDGDDFSAFTFAFSPTLDLGLRWAIVPDKFYLNAGSSIKFFDLGSKTSTIDTYTNDSKTGDRIEVNKTFGGATTGLTLGFTFNPTANLGVQAMSGVDFNTNNVSLFSTAAASGLAVFSKIMVTLKF